MNDNDAGPQNMPGRRSLPVRRDAADTDGFRVAPVGDSASLSTSASLQRGAVDPMQQVRALLRWKWTIVSVFCAVAGLSLLGIWTMLEPMYGSTAVVRIAASVPRVLYKTEDNGTVPLFNAYINTQVSVIQSPEVLARVFDRSDVQATEWYSAATAASMDPSRLVDRLAKQLSVTLRRGTELVDVAMETRVPADAAVIVNAVADEYKKYWDKAQLESEQQRVVTLRDQLAGAQKRINELFELKFSLAEKMGTRLHEEERTRMISELRNRRAALEMLQQERRLRSIEAEERTKAVRENPGETDIDVLDSIRLATIPAEIQADPAWVRHQEEYVAARKRLDLAKRQFGEAHPKLQSALADVEQARRMLRLTEQRLGLEPYSYSAGPRIVEEREGEMERSIDALQRQLAEADGRAQELARTDEMYNEQKLMRKSLMERLNALETESNAPARVSLQSAGLVRLTPTSDRRWLFSACAFVAAIMISLGVGYGRGRIDPKIHDLADIGGDVGNDTPFLGQLPRARRILALDDDTLLGQAINENVRIIRTMLLQRLGGKGGAIVVTSPEACTGKTTVAILLARSFASMGKRVLLVDVDMLHPSISQQYRAISLPGLRGILTGMSTDADAIIRGDVNGMDVLPFGVRNGARDNDVLAQGAFAAAIQRWKVAYDVVLMDCPPVLSMADARIAAAHADGSIMVLRSSGSNREDAIEAFAGLSACGAKLLGSILVGVSRGSAYYPYNYYARRPAAAELLA